MGATQRRGGKGTKIGEGIYDHQKKFELNRSDHQVMISVGYGFVPTRIGSQNVYDLAVGYGEIFGKKDQFRYQLVLEPFFNFNPGLLGLSIAGELHWRLSDLKPLSLTP